MTVPTKIEARLLFLAVNKSQTLDRIIRAVLVGGKARFIRCLGFVFMIQRQLKLKLTPRQERQLDRWLFHLTPIWNWAIKKLEREAAIGIYHSRFDLQKMLNGHNRRLGLPQDAIAGTLNDG